MWISFFATREVFTDSIFLDASSHEVRFPQHLDPFHPKELQTHLLANAVCLSLPALTHKYVLAMGIEAMSLVFSDRLESERVLRGTNLLCTLRNKLGFPAVQVTFDHL